MKTNLLFPAMLISLYLAGCATKPPLTTVSEVNLKQYAGTWHEIARYPNWFQRSCQSEVLAKYVPQPDGSIQVINSCRSADGSKKSVIGRATIVPNSGNAKLKVTFFAPFSGDYWIIALDEKNYSWAVVGHPSRKYLWVLAREPQFANATYRQILQLIREKGYNPSKLIRDKN